MLSILNTALGLPGGNCANQAFFGFVISSRAYIPSTSNPQIILQWIDVILILLKKDLEPNRFHCQIYLDSIFCNQNLRGKTKMMKLSIRRAVPVALISS